MKIENHSALPKNLSEMTWQEVAEELEHTDLILIPVGSTEEHGPHLPLATDTIQGEEVSKRVVARLMTEGIRAVAGPTIPFGVSLHLMGFSGTVTLTPAKLQTLIKEICDSLIKHGFRRFVLFNAHFHNVGALYCAAQEISQRPGVQAVVVNWAPAMKQQYPHLLKSGRGGHGGEGETACVLASIPQLVCMERARVYLPRQKEKLDWDESIDAGGAILDLPHDMKELTPVGSMGDPTVATAETGEKLYNFVVEWTCQIIKRHFDFAGGARPNAHVAKEPLDA
jgi:creatinine amidohydrolase